ncbi:MAG: HlyD family efflux transporter periplasmic adaptor subunit, partial [Planctomycetes bacterium]|nr:HlyD family efflux transporter periplasmic adaptor subunit [Planctomycetota bacterium]
AALDRARNGPRREEVDAARAALEEARARLALLRAGPRPEESRAAAAALSAAEAELARAEEDVVRKRELLAGAAVTRDELDAALAVRDRLLARRDEAKARADLVAAGARKEEIDEAAAAVSRREADLALLVAGTRAEEITAAEARLAAARAHHAAIEADLAERVVRAPEPALLEVLAVRPGDVLAAGAPVARLQRAGDLWVKVFLPETEMGRLAVGREVGVTVDSFPGRTFRGKVAWIGARAEYTPRNVQSPEERRHQVFAVKVVVEDPQGVFQSGMAASVAVDGAPPPR